MTRLLAAAIACGATPLAAGTAIYLAWRATRWDGFMVMGLATILLGLVAFLAGAICLTLHALRNVKTRRNRMIWDIILVGGLLLVNFPAAAFLVWSANEVLDRYTLTIRNESEVAVQNFKIDGPCQAFELKTLPPGGQVVADLYFGHDGSLRFTAEQSGKKLAGTIEGYVTNSFGRSKTLCFKPNGTFEMEDEHR